MLLQNNLYCNLMECLDFGHECLPTENSQTELKTRHSCPIRVFLVEG